MVISDVELLKEPSPDVVHVTDEAPPPIVPERTAGEPAQMIMLLPANAVVREFKVSVMQSLAARQVPAGSSVVKHKITVPDEISMGPGV